MNKQRRNFPLKISALYLIGLMSIVFFVGAFDINTSLSNAIQFIQRIVITDDGSNNGNTIMDINTGGNIIAYGTLLDGELNPYITGYTETDPIFMTGTQNKRCYFSGGKITCNQNSPTGNTGAQGATGFLQAGVLGATPYRDGTDWITSSTNIFNTGGNVGVGVDTPSVALQVSGSVIFGQASSNSILSPINSYNSVLGGISNIITGDSSSFSSIGGGIQNTINGRGSFIGGGMENSISLVSSSPAGSFIGGGGENLITGNSSVIVGGGGIFRDQASEQINGGNHINGNFSFIGGGGLNIIYCEEYSFNYPKCMFNTIVGGWNNTMNTYSSNGIAEGSYNFIGGGSGNIITGTTDNSTIPGGISNIIQNSSNSFAAGQSAQAIDTDNVFVWNSDFTTPFISEKSNTFIVNVSGGFGINTANPQKALDVSGDIQTNSALYLTGGTTPRRIILSGNHLLIQAYTGGVRGQVSSNGAGDFRVQ